MRYVRERNWSHGFQKIVFRQAYVTDQMDKGGEILNRISLRISNNHVRRVQMFECLFH